MPSPDFPATRWSVIATARGPGDRGAAQTALGELCRIYWYPLYAFARRNGCNAQDAEDSTQSFLAGILEDNLFATADPALGRLRSFLLKAFSRDLADTRRDAQRAKRGGGVEHIPLDLALAEERFRAEPAGAEPVHQFEATWATAVLEGAMSRVEAEYADGGRGEVFAALRPLLGGTEPPPDSTELGRVLGLNPPALRQAISRLRDRFRRALRAQIGDTLREPSEAAIDEELRTLRAVLAER